ncbi:MAG: hypothetical protein ACI4BA_02985 [Prevotella sp.]
MFTKRFRVWYIIVAVVIVALATACWWLFFRSNTQQEEQTAYDMLRKGQQEFNVNHVPEAFYNLQQAHGAFKKQDNQDALFECTVYLVMLYDQIGRRDTAYTMLRHLHYRDVAPYSFYSSQYYLRMMAYYYLTLVKDYDKAEEYNQRAINFSKLRYPNDSNMVFMDMANQAELCIYKKDLKKSMQLIEEVERRAPKEHSIINSQLYRSKGMISEIQGNPDTAYQYYSTAVHYAKKAQAFDNLKAALQSMLAIDSARTDFLNYVNHRHALDSLTTVLEGDQVHYKIAVMQEQYKMDMLLRAKENSDMRHNLILNFMAITIVALIVILLLVIKNLKAKRRMVILERQRGDAETARQQAEKELLNLKMEKKQQQLNEIKKENVVMGLQIASKSDEIGNLSSFERSVKELDPDFLKRLNKHYPQLSQNDVRLISFIRMGMNSQEIASLFNITVESLHKTRYRLRKKMQLKQGEDLDATIKML